MEDYFPVMQNVKRWNGGGPGEDAMGPGTGHGPTLMWQPVGTWRKTWLIQETFEDFYLSLGKPVVNYLVTAYGSQTISPYSETVLCGKILMSEFYKK